MKGVGIKLPMVKNILANNLDKFGYYKIGDKKTYSKLEAIELHDHTGVHPEWEFNSAEFSCYDWSKEPSESLGELYKNRAQQIRDKYDYLVLFFSGGSDSSNILDVFVKNNIKLDEVASFWSYDGDKSYDSHFSAEISKVAIPRMKKLSHIKHRLIDLSELMNQVFNKKEVLFNWIYFMSSHLSPNNYVRSHLRRLIPEYKKLIDEGKSVCFIWGAEKPKLDYINNKYCVRFQDLIDNSVSPYLQQFSLPGEFDELFYWSPDFAKGIIKQSHIIMKYLKFAEINPLDFTEYNQKYYYGMTVREGKTFYLLPNGINRLLYEDWNIKTFSVGKPKNTIFSERDRWFFKTIPWNSSAKNYFIGLKKLDEILTKNVNGYWKNNPNDILRGIKGNLSKPYFLE